MRKILIPESLIILIKGLRFLWKSLYKVFELTILISIIINMLLLAFIIILIILGTILGHDHIPINEALSNYFYSGHLFGIESWRIHLGSLFIFFVISCVITLDESN